MAGVDNGQHLDVGPQAPHPAEQPVEDGAVVDDDRLVVSDDFLTVRVGQWVGDPVTGEGHHQATTWAQRFDRRGEVLLDRVMVRVWIDVLGDKPAQYSSPVLSVAFRSGQPAQCLATLGPAGLRDGDADRGQRGTLARHDRAGAVVRLVGVQAALLVGEVVAGAAGEDGVEAGAP